MGFTLSECVCGSESKNTFQQCDRSEKFWAKAEFLNVVSCSDSHDDPL
jgi:hypothetical protein